MRVDERVLSAFLDDRFTIIKARHVNAACTKMATANPAAVIAPQKVKPWDLHVLREHLAEDSRLHLVDEQSSIEELAALINAHHPAKNTPRL